MDIRPDPKLLTKRWIGLLVLLFWLAVLAGLLQVLIPLDPETTFKEVARFVWPIGGAVYVIIVVIAVPVSILWIKNLLYRLEDDRIIIFKGILTKTQQNIPYRAITDVLLHRSLVDRMLGIGTIRIQTAGQSHTGTGYEGDMPGLLHWESLHEEIRGRLRRNRGEMDPTTVSAPESAADARLRLLEEIRDELRDIRTVLEQGAPRG